MEFLGRIDEKRRLARFLSLEEGAMDCLCGDSYSIGLSWVEESDMKGNP